MNSRRSLRVWPGVLVAGVIVLLRFIVPAFVPDVGAIGVLAAATGGLLIVIWWLFFSRAPWPERIGVIVLIVLAAALTRLLVHPSVAGGMMGLMVFAYALPATLTIAFVIWAVLSQRLSGAQRWTTLVVALVVGCGVWLLVRTDGLMGASGAQLAWRWTPTAEERLLARGADEPVPAAGPVSPTPSASPGTTRESELVSPASAPPTAVPAPSVTAAADPAPARAALGVAEWPGFRGTNRDGVVRGVRLATDWATTPPVEVWRRPIGPGWSSFAVQGDRIYTQEQRGEDELVSCYRVSTGAPVWRHRDGVRFYESNGGAGPRGTPTIHDGRVYSVGATGIVNALSAADGAVVWSRNAASDTGAALPGWGFSSSPLAVQDLVIVAASGRLVAYDASNGQPRWTRTNAGGGYSSPHLAMIDSVAQVLMLNGGGITSVSPADGHVLWEHRWQDGVSIVQPALTPDGDILLAGGDMMGGTGIRRLAATRRGDTWTVEERWTSRGLKPYFNDFVVHEGHAYGFDGSILSSINLADGERNWKGGRYGQGQLVLLEEQDLLLIMAEEGDLALVSAAPDKHTEIATFKAIEGKTWNHPVVVRDLLLVRNGEEMAAFRLPLASR